MDGTPFFKLNLSAILRDKGRNDAYKWEIQKNPFENIQSDT